MGKKKLQNAETRGEQCPSTVFVSNLPYSFTTNQLEQTFSEVGPLRRCFMVTQKGSNEHRGFGFVQFAVSEDANRAVELKNGSSVGGRKIGVKHANPRASLEQRRSKANQVAHTGDGKVKEDEKDADVDAPAQQKEATRFHKEGPKATKTLERDSEVKKNKSDGTVHAPAKQKEAVKSHTQGKPIPPKKAKMLCTGLVDTGKHSEKQRVARTVIIGGILNDDMSKDLISCAKEIDGFCSVRYPIPKEELEQHGLAQDGCKLEAAAVLYASVRSACAAVSKLHRKVIRGANVWARQLGGEGSKTQKWKLIVHNLPFKVQENEIREKFSSAGFVWDVCIPHNPGTGLSKGFAFVKFTSKQHAEKAMQMFNGQKFGKRTIAVDWAVDKKIYASAANAVPSDEGKHAEGAVDTDSDDGNSSDYDMEKVDEGTHGSDTDPDDSEIPDNKASDTAADFEEEAKIAQKVLQNLMNPSARGTSASSGNNSNLAHEDQDSEEAHDDPIMVADASPAQSSQTKLKNNSKTNVVKSNLTEDNSELQRTIFISNIPFEIDAEEVKLRFTSFGEVESFFPVLHKVTGRPRGTGFLKFKTADAVSAAVSAANAGPGLGIFLKGRQLTVLKALNKKSAQDIALEKSKNEETDRRNLYLAKEGLILEGTPAAEGVSVSDMEKRKLLESKKHIKLRSPNFHVSRTRLVIYNIPKSMDVKELKKVCIGAVTSRAADQKPVIHQIKFLQDTKKGKVVSKNYSRGVAFVEFAEHEHALLALRALNNNPETFSPEHRPIVEFALDNVKTLRWRDMKIQSQRQENTGNEDDMGMVDEQKGDDPPTFENKKFEKRKPYGEKREHEDPTQKSHNGVEASEEDRGTSKKQRKTDFKNKNSQEGEKKPDHAKPIKEDNQTEKEVESHEPKAWKKSKKRSERDEVSEVQAKGSILGKKGKKNKDPVGKDAADKLDVLIEQFRAKFANRGSEKRGKEIRRWFQS